MAHTKMAFLSRDHSVKDLKQNAIHIVVSARSQRLVQHTNPMALITSAELNKPELPAAHDVG